MTQNLHFGENKHSVSLLPFGEIVPYIPRGRRRIISFSTIYNTNPHRQSDRRSSRSDKFDSEKLSRQPNKRVPESGKFLKVSRVKDLTRSIRGSVTPRVWSSLVRGCSERSGVLVFGVLVFKRLRRNHEETSMADWLASKSQSETATDERVHDLLRSGLS